MGSCISVPREGRLDWLVAIALELTDSDDAILSAAAALTARVAQQSLPTPPYSNAADEPKRNGIAAPVAKDGKYAVEKEHKGEMAGLPALLARRSNPTNWATGRPAMAMLATQRVQCKIMRLCFSIILAHRFLILDVIARLLSDLAF